MRLLALDTATDACSAALWLDGELLSHSEHQPRRHGELILPMIDALLAQAGIDLRRLDAIAFGRGPGAFTGVRLAASVTQGLAFSADLPVLPVSDLRAVAQRALSLEGAPAQVLVCQDARMAEVYCGCFVRRAGFACAAGNESVCAPAEVLLPSDLPPEGWWGAGSGFEAYPALRDKFAARFQRILPALLPDAREIAVLAAHEGLAAARPAQEALPVYLRDQVASVPARN